MGQEYFSFETVLEVLQLDEDELKRLVSEGELRAFRDEDRMRFRRSDVEARRTGRITEPTVLLPAPAAALEDESSACLLVEDDTSSTVLEGLEIDLSDVTSGEDTVAETVAFDLDFEPEEEPEPPRRVVDPARPRRAARPVKRTVPATWTSWVAGLSFAVLILAAIVVLGLPAGLESPATRVATSIAGAFAPPAFVEDPGIHPAARRDGEVSEDERSWYRAWRDSSAR